MVYINETSKQVVQVHIRRLVIEQSNMLLAGTVVHGGKSNLPTEESMRAGRYYDHDHSCADRLSFCA